MCAYKELSRINFINLWKGNLLISTVIDRKCFVTNDISGCLGWTRLKEILTLAADHAMFETPVPVQTLRLSNIEPGEFLDERQLGNSRCC